MLLPYTVPLLLQWSQHLGQALSGDKENSSICAFLMLLYKGITGSTAVTTTAAAAAG